LGELSEATVREYLAGASLAFGIVLLTFQVINAYYSYTGVEWQGLAAYADAFFALFIGIHIFGGVLGGYLVGRKREEKILKAGIVTAVIAYVIEYIYYIIFERVFPGSLWALLGFVFGGVVGAFLAVVQKTRRTLTSSQPLKRE